MNQETIQQFQHISCTEESTSSITSTIVELLNLDAFLPSTGRVLIEETQKDYELSYSTLLEKKDFPRFGEITSKAQNILGFKFSLKGQRSLPLFSNTCLSQPSDNPGKDIQDDGDENPFEVIEINKKSFEESAINYGPIDFLFSSPFIKMLPAEQRILGLQGDGYLESYLIKCIKSGNSYRNNGNYHQAIESYQKAIQINKTRKYLSQENLGTLYYHLGIAQKAIKDFPNSIKNLNEALNIYKTIFKKDDPEMIIDTYYTLGCTCLEAKKEPLAMKAFLEGYFNSQDDSANLSDMLYLLRKFFLKTPDHENAIKFFKRACLVSKKAARSGLKKNLYLIETIEKESILISRDCEF